MEQFQSGFRFSPSDEELINDHLMRKVLGYIDDCIIPEIDDFYAYDPWDLPSVYQGRSSVPTDGWDWFFLCPSPYMAQNSERVKRKTKSGNWKITSQKDDVKTRNTRVLIGTKRILTFYKNRVKTGWVMHEYHLNPELVNGYSSILQIPYVLCRLKRKPEESLDIPPNFEGGSSASAADDTHYASHHGWTGGSSATDDTHYASQHGWTGGSSAFDDTHYASQHGWTEDTDHESSYQETVASLSQIEILDNLPNDYSNYSHDPQLYMYVNWPGQRFL